MLSIGDEVTCTISNSGFWEKSREVSCMALRETVLNKELFSRLRDERGVSNKTRSLKAMFSEKSAVSIGL